MELQQAFETKARLARRRVQFPSAGMSRDDALDELDRVNAAWVMLQNGTSPPAPRGSARGASRSPRHRHAPVSPSPGGWQILWDTLRVYYQKISVAIWQAGLTLWLSVRRSWRNTRATARWIAALYHARTRFLFRVTGVPPNTVIFATAILLFVALSFFFLVLTSRTPERLAVALRHAPSLEAPETRLPATATTLSAESESRKGTVQFLTWPPSHVYIDGELVVEAPSPEKFSLTPGIHSMELRSKQGQRRLITFEVSKGKQYVLKFNFETGRLDFLEELP